MDLATYKSQGYAPTNTGSILSLPGGPRPAKQPKPYRYKTNCVNSTEEKIHKMTAEARQVSYEQFARQCHGLQAWAKQMGYSTNPGKSGDLTLQKDWHVDYRRSMYNGVKCYYLVHSAIEYIWTLGGE